MTASISIALSFDKAYAEHATVMLYSLLHHNANNRFDVWVFYNDLDEETKERIQHNLKIFPNAAFHWYKIDQALIASFVRREGHVNEYSYSRIYIGEILQDLDRVLYLDCDLLVLDDLAPLWNADLHRKCAGVVLDPSTRHHDIGLPKGTPYFNAGVMLMDLRKWRAEGYTKKVADKLYELGDRAWERDQDGLNAVLYNDRHFLDGRWNLQSHAVAAAQQQRKNPRLSLRPAIVHFTGNLKPWNYKSSNPFKSDYYRYLNRTDFKQTHRAENKTAVNVARRMVRNALVKTGLLKY